MSAPAQNPPTIGRYEEGSCHAVGGGGGGGVLVFLCVGVMMNHDVQPRVVDGEDKETAWHENGLAHLLHTWCRT